MRTLGDTALVVAQRKAKRATENYIDEHGEHPFNCGYTHVVVKGVRGNKAKLLKEYGFSKRYDGPGLSKWNPSGSFTQDMSAKMAGAEVYAKFLRECGLNAEAHCRLD